jgi:hypothetical protein
MNSLLIALATLAAASPATIPVDAGRAEWGNYPVLERRVRPLPTSQMVGEMSAILEQANCSLPNQHPDRFDIDVPYLAQIGPTGRPLRFVVADIGCPEVELLVGRVLNAMALAGDFHAPGGRQVRWYADKLNFNLNSR